MTFAHTADRVLLNERSFHFATNLADHVNVLGNGWIRWAGTAAASRAATGVKT